MNYFLSLELPLWWFFLPLVIAGLLAAKLYQWQRIFSKMKANYQLQLREAQNRLDEALNAEGNSLTRQSTEYKAKIHKLETDAAGREALIISLNKQVELLRHTVDVQRLVDEGSELIQQQLTGEIDKLQSDFTAALAVINRTKRATKQWDKIMKDKAVNVVNTVIEAVKQKQYVDNYNPTTFPHVGETIAEKLEEMGLSIEDVSNQTCLTIEYLHKLISCKVSITTIASKEIERITGIKADFLMRFQAKYDEVMTNNIVYDNLGVPVITQADQSEDFNARHIKELGSEVVRGIEQQNAAIKKELQQVDMSQLEAGDRVYLRGEGFDRLVESVIKYGSWCFEVKMVGYNSPKCYYSTGRWDSEDLHSNDIIQIIKQPKITKSNKRKDCNSGCDSLCRELCDDL